MKIKTCKICSSKKLHRVIELEKFPLTGIFYKKKKNFKFKSNYDQSLNLCKSCGHLQLQNFIDPKILYNNVYANRTSQSHLSDNAMNFFLNFFNRIIKKKNLNILEIGSNDLKFAKNLAYKCKNFYAFDPIWIGKKKYQEKKIKVFGNYIENFSIKKNIEEPLDVIISTHNLEHINNPVKVLQNLTNFLKSDGYIFIEVPDANLMLKNLRFDQIFHQHYHYFGLNSLQNIAKKINCEIIGKKINHKYWGGSLLIVMKKKTNLDKKPLKNNYKQTNNVISKNYLKFKKKYLDLNKKIKRVKENLYGYGAGQMTPSFAYHLGSDLSFLNFIIDDNPKRNNYKYFNLSPKIFFKNKQKINKNDVALITALDGTESISKKLRRGNFKFINPLK